MENIYKLKIFSWLQKKDIDAIITSSPQKSFKKDEVIFVQWEKNDWNAYIIIKWSVWVNIFNKEVSELWEWEIFWEIALLNDELRTATIKAKEDLQTIVINIENLLKIIDKNPSINKDIIKRIESNLLLNE